MTMMSEEIELGKAIFIGIVHDSAPAVEVKFNDAGHGYYKVLLIGRSSTSRRVSEENLADLAASGGGGVQADIKLRIKEALEEIGEIGRP